MMVKSKTLMRLAFVLSIVTAIGTYVIAGEEKYDESTPLETLQSAAKEGDTEAMLVYGMRLMQGEGTEVNTAEGLDWLHKASMPTLQYIAIHPGSFGIFGKSLQHWLHFGKR